MRIVVIGGTGLAGRHAAEALAGVGHHVLLSILGVDRIAGNAHYAGKRRQEDLVRGGPVPWTIVRAAQFHEFAIQVVDWTLRSRIERPPAGRSGGKWPLPGAICRRRHRLSAGLAAEESAALGGRRSTMRPWRGATSGSCRAFAGSSAPTWPARSTSPARGRASRRRPSTTGWPAWPGSAVVREVRVEAVCAVDAVGLTTRATGRLP